jgi:hypothetical protein
LWPLLAAISSHSSDPALTSLMTFSRHAQTSGKTKRMPSNLAIIAFGDSAWQENTLRAAQQIASQDDVIRREIADA